MKGLLPALSSRLSCSALLCLLQEKLRFLFHFEGHSLTCWAGVLPFTAGLGVASPPPPLSPFPDFFPGVFSACFPGVLSPFPGVLLSLFPGVFLPLGVFSAAWACLALDFPGVITFTGDVVLISETAQLDLKCKLIWLKLFDIRFWFMIKHCSDLVLRIFPTQDCYKLYFKFTTVNPILSWSHPFEQKYTSLLTFFTWRITHLQTQKRLIWVQFFICSLCWCRWSDHKISTDMVWQARCQ